MSISVTEALAIARALTDAANQIAARGDTLIPQSQIDASFARADASLDKLAALIAAKKSSEGEGAG